MKRILPLLLLATVLAGCDSPRKTTDEIRKDIAAYKEAPGETTKNKIEEGFSTLGKQIADLDAKGKTAEAASYRATAESLRADYRSAQMIRAMKDAQSTIEGVGSALKEAGKSIGDAFKKNPSPTPEP